MIRKLFFVLAALGLSLSSHADRATLRPSTASQVVPFGPLVDSADASTEAGLAPIADTEFTVCQDGGSCAAKNDTTDATHLSDGVYAITLDATDTAATDYVTVSHSIAGVLARTESYKIEATGWVSLRNGATSLLTALDAGLVEGPTTIDGAPTSQTQFLIAVGAANDDAYNDHTICFVSGSNKDCSQISDYIGSTNEVFLYDDPEFTISSGDTVRIFRPGASDTLLALLSDIADVQTAADTILEDTGTMAGTNGAVLDTSQPNYAPAVAGDAMNLAINAIDTTEMTDELKSQLLGKAFYITSSIGTSTTLVDTSLATIFDTDEIVDWTVTILGGGSGNVIGFEGQITAYDTATHTVTFTPAALDIILGGMEYTIHRDFALQEVQAVKVKTDDLTFTNPGEVDVNVKSMNDAEVLGSGTAVDPWNGE